MSGPQSSILQVNDLETRFFTRKGIVRAVDGISFAVGKGRIVGIVGESGCGKSVTSLSIMGLVPSPAGKVTGGSIIFDSQDLITLGSREMCAIRGKDISMIFQEPMTSLNPVYTVGRQVGEALRIHAGADKNEIRERVIEAFDQVGIPEPAARVNAYPHQLSGGLRQRVMIAMALICEPRLLIADEPTTALDVTIQAQILELMMKLRDRLDTAIIMITHDLGVIAEICDDVNVMYAGKIIETSDVFTLFRQPAHPYTQGLLRAIPSITTPGKRTRLASIDGMVPNLLHLPAGCRFQPRCEAAMEICCRREPPLVALGDGHRVRCWLHQKKGESK